MSQRVSSSLPFYIDKLIFRWNAQHRRRRRHFFAASRDLREADDMSGFMKFLDLVSERE